MLAGCFQLDAGAFGERLHPEIGEVVIRRSQVLACVEASALTPQPFAVEEVGAGEIDAHAGSAEALDRLGVQIRRLTVLG
jgi:hypothetical protein